MKKIYQITESQLQEFQLCDGEFKQGFYKYLEKLSDVKERDKMMMEAAVNWTLKNLVSNLKEVTTEKENLVASDKALIEHNWDDYCEAAVNTEPLWALGENGKPTPPKHLQQMFYDVATKQYEKLRSAGLLTNKFSIVGYGIDMMASGYYESLSKQK
jgi:hypothetical protein